MLWELQWSSVSVLPLWLELANDTVEGLLRTEILEARGSGVSNKASSYSLNMRLVYRN